MASANWPWPPQLKVAVVSSGVVLASFVVASMLLRLPGVRRHIAAGITGVLNAGSATPGDTAPAVLHLNVEDALAHLFVTPVG